MVQFDGPDQSVLGHKLNKLSLSAWEKKEYFVSPVRLPCRKLIVLFTSGYELKTASKLGMQHVSTCSALEAYLYIGQTHVGPMVVAPVSVSSYVSFLVDSVGHVLLVSSIRSASYNLSDSSSMEFPEPGEERHEEDVPVKTESSKLSPCLYIDQL